MGEDEIAAKVEAKFNNNDFTDVNPGAVGDIKSGIKQAIAEDNQESEVPLLHKTYEEALDHSDHEQQQAEAPIDEELSAKYGADVAVDEDGTVSFIIDGEKVSGQDLMSNYINSREVNSQEKELDEHKLHVMQSRYQSCEIAKSKIDSAQSSLNTLKRVANLAANSINWAQLASDPEAYNNAKQQIQQKFDNLNQIEQMIGDASNSINKEFNGVTGEYDQRQSNNAVGMIKKAMPEWEEPAAMQAGMQELGQFLEGYGFTKEELEKAIYQPKLLLVAIDAFKRKRINNSIRSKIVHGKSATLSNNHSIASSGSQDKRKAKALRDDVVRSNGSVDSIANILMSRM